MIRRLALSGATLLCALLLGLPPQAQAAAPAWRLTVTPNADYLFSDAEPHPGVYKVEAENSGNKSTSGTIAIHNALPPGLTPLAVTLYEGVAGSGFALSSDIHEGNCPSLAECDYASALKPHEELVMVVLASVQENLEGQLSDTATVSGGGAGGVEGEGSNAASLDPPFGLLRFATSLTDSSKATLYSQAGGHPYQFSTEFGFETYSSANRIAIGSGSEQWPAFGTAPLGDPKEIVTELPPGLLADAQAIPTCELADFFVSACSRQEDVVGDIYLDLYESSEGGYFEPVYNLQPQGAYPGELGSTVAGIPFILVTADLRTGSDYGVTATSFAQEAGLSRVRLILWGVPADESHDSLRGVECDREGVISSTISQQEASCEAEGAGYTAEGSGAPFLRMPTSCPGSSLAFAGRYDTWQNPGVFAGKGSEAPAVDGCAQLHFDPSIEAHPTTDRADSASGLQFDLHVPQGCWKAEGEAGYEPLCQSDLSEAVVTLPAGLSLNPSSGNGLEGCSPEQIGLETPVGQTPAHFSETPAQCPEASAIGTAEVKTPLLHNPLKGVIYIATPGRNPFRSLLANYVVFEGEGLIVKLPANFALDPQTGQIVSKFLENPPTPFEDFHLSYFGGARGDLRTPPACGAYKTTSAFTPYSHVETTEAGETVEATPIAEPSSEFELENGGAPCPHQASEQPNAPTFRAGTESPQAGAFTPFSFRIAREDGSQEISKIETTLPPGLTGKLAGVGECSDAQLAVAQSREHEGGGAEEQASPSCPASSEVGTVEVASGAGPTPLYVQGKAYLSGPYKGAPLSLAIITPALAGPFGLGDVLVRTALFVNPETAQIKAVSDEIPHILQGIPLDVRSITLKMARPNFTLNPTNCNELGFTGNAFSVLNAVAPLSKRFQVGGCSTLPFNPKLKLSLKGKTRRAGTPALKAVLTMKPGEANIAKAQVTLPPSAFLDNAHIVDVCTQVQFHGAGCPAGSVLGHARAETPLLDHPLEGPVYLMAGFGHKLPDVAADLNGQIRVLLHGKVDTGRGGAIRNTFEVVPDAPVSRFTLSLKGGHRGLIENSKNLCARKQVALAKFTAQSGKLSLTEPVVKVFGCPKGHKGKGHHHGKRHRPSRGG